MSKKKQVLIGLSLFITIIFIGLSIYSQSTPKQLYPKEILEYKGQDLSSINDFRENSIRGPQQINESTYKLVITGLVNQTIKLSYNEIINNFQKYQKVTTLNCVEGWSVNILWEGFLLEEIIEKAETAPESEVAIFYAYDGYSTSLPIDYIKNQEIMLAYKMNDVILPPERGFPFQLVAENKYGYKWIKWITEIELSNNTSYKGYWETRGFSNDASVK